jgi:hypothetical protein
VQHRAGERIGGAASRRRRAGSRVRFLGASGPPGVRVQLDCGSACSVRARDEWLPVGASSSEASSSLCKASGLRAGGTLRDRGVGDRSVVAVGDGPPAVVRWARACAGSGSARPRPWSQVPRREVRIGDARLVTGVRGLVLAPARCSRRLPLLAAHARADARPSSPDRERGARGGAPGERCHSSVACCGAGGQPGSCGPPLRCIGRAARVWTAPPPIRRRRLHHLSCVLCGRGEGRLTLPAEPDTGGPSASGWRPYCRATIEGRSPQLSGRRVGRHSGGPKQGGHLGGLVVTPDGAVGSAPHAGSQLGAPLTSSEILLVWAQSSWRGCAHEVWPSSGAERAGQRTDRGGDHLR